MTSSSPVIPSSLDLSTKPILLLPKSISSIKAGSIPRRIQITSSSPSSLKPSAADIATGTAPSSLITIRPASLSLSLTRGQPSISTKSNASATAKPLPPLRAQLSSFQRILNRLSPRSPPHDSQATARPRSPLLVGIEGVKIDELEHEKCFRCDHERDRDAVEMKRVGIHGLQWVCKGSCSTGTPFKADESSHQRSYRCDGARDKEGVGMKGIEADNLQWVCKRGCASGPADGVRQDSVQRHIPKQRKEEVLP